MVEMAFRSYDPCFSCATHAIYDEMPLTVLVYGAGGELLREYKREL